MATDTLRCPARDACEVTIDGRAKHGPPDAAGALDRFDYALTAGALARAEAGARLLGQSAAPSWRARAEERFDAAERAGVTEAELTALLREHGQAA
jgi:hypothetical protein